MGSVCGNCAEDDVKSVLKPPTHGVRYVKQMPAYLMNKDMKPKRRTLSVTFSENVKQESHQQQTDKQETKKEDDKDGPLNPEENTSNNKTTKESILVQEDV